jgi:large subunit ribosomal protein L24
MKKAWSKMWNSSTQKRKQRKYLFNAPLHIKHKLLTSPLSAELKKEYNTRNAPVRVGDTVSVEVGQFKKKSGKVTKISLARTKVYVEGVAVKRSDGTDAQYPLHPSNLKITKFDTTDKRRVEKLESHKEVKETKKKEAEK